MSVIILSVFLFFLQMFSAYVGYLYGIRKKVFLAITNFNVFVLSATSECINLILPKAVYALDHIDGLVVECSLCMRHAGQETPIGS